MTQLDPPTAALQTSWQLAERKISLVGATWWSPHIVHHIGQEFHEYPDYPNRILVLYGSAIHVAPEGESTLLDGAYPTVGTLRAPLSPFSTRDRAWYLGNTTTHFILTDRFTDRVHRDGLENFWSAYFLSQGSPLLTFSSDPRIADRVLNPDLPGLPATRASSPCGPCSSSTTT